MVITVHKLPNLDTCDEQVFVGISHREAVVAAYAQSLKDWNTWTYKEKYDHEVKTHGRVVTCGAFTAVLPKEG